MGLASLLNRFFFHMWSARELRPGRKSGDFLQSQGVLQLLLPSLNRPQKRFRLAEDAQYQGTSFEGADHGRYLVEGEQMSRRFAAAEVKPRNAVAIHNSERVHALTGIRGPGFLCLQFHQ